LASAAGPSQMPPRWWVAGIEGIGGRHQGRSTGAQKAGL